MQNVKKIKHANNRLNGRSNENCKIRILRPIESATFLLLLSLESPASFYFFLFLFFCNIWTYKIRSCTSAASARHSARKAAKAGRLGPQECLWSEDRLGRMFLAALLWPAWLSWLPSRWFSYTVLSPRPLYRTSRRLPEDEKKNFEVWENESSVCAKIPRNTRQWDPRELWDNNLR